MEVQARARSEIGVGRTERTTRLRNHPPPAALAERGDAAGVGTRAAITRLPLRS